VTDSRYNLVQLYARLAESSDARQHEKCDCDRHQGRGEESSKASRPEDGETEIRKGRYDGDEHYLGVVIRATGRGRSRFI
jgi:hypothetical protein